jgi:uncharacterized membrane protein
MKTSTIAGFGLLLAGAAAVEAVLIPGLLLGVAVVLAPKFLMRGRPIVGKRSPKPNTAVRPVKLADATALSTVVAPGAISAPFEIKQAIFKTITFRIIVTSFDFAANTIVIGNVTTAAGLSAFGLVGAPLFYFCHEFFWHRLAPTGTKVDVGTLLGSNKARALSGGRGLTINRTLAKTITYEIVTTVVDFGANYVATRDVAAAAGLTVFAAVISPFIYFGHEKVWDHFGAGDMGSQGQRISPIPAKQKALSLSSAAA